MSIASFHDGERAVQSRVGVRDAVESIGQRILRDHMPDQHRELFAKLPLLLLGTLDPQGRPWASVITGAPGFVHTPDARTLTAAARPVPFDPGRENIVVGAPIGMLGIELDTRRRNRVNGTIAAVTENGFEVRVQQSFGNCPKYIQARTPRSAPLEAPRATPQAALLDARASALVERADTFFIASASRNAGAPSISEGVDVSHRGGKPGFVRLASAAEATLLTWPDFVGNYLFNTIGNLEANPRAGLLFIDFDSGDLLSVTCHANVIWEGPEKAGFAGAQRLISARVVAGVLIERAVPLRWSPPEQARELAATGSW